MKRLNWRQCGIIIRIQIYYQTLVAAHLEEKMWHFVFPVLMTGKDKGVEDPKLVLGITYGKINPR